MKELFLINIGLLMGIWIEGRHDWALITAGTLIAILVAAELFWRR